MNHKNKRLRTASKAVARGVASTKVESFVQFASQTTIRWCLYRDTEKILGRTFGALVLQDFEAMTPNMLARTIETVEGGGIVVILLRSMECVEEFYTLPMDVHAKFRTCVSNVAITSSREWIDSLQLMPRFNQRFILTLIDCDRCLFLNDQLAVLPLKTNKPFWPSNNTGVKRYACSSSQTVHICSGSFGSVM